MQDYIKQEKRIKLIARLMLIYKQPFSEFAKVETEILQMLLDEARVIQSEYMQDMMSHGKSMY